MSRPRRRARPADGMPDWLAVYRPEAWVWDPEDLLEVHYFGRHAWMVARTEWQAGGSPSPGPKIPRPVASRGVNTVPIRAEAPSGALPWEQNRAAATPRARPIKLH